MCDLQNRSLPEIGRIDDVLTQLLVCRRLEPPYRRRQSGVAHDVGRADRALPQGRRGCRCVGGPVLPPAGAIVARADRGRRSALHVSRAEIRAFGQVRRGPRPRFRPQQRGGSQLPSRRAGLLGLAVDGRSGARRPGADPGRSRTRPSGLVHADRPTRLRGQLRADQRQSPRSNSSQLCAREDPRPEQHELGRKPATGHADRAGFADRALGR